jgi:cystathionine beta-synthase/cysteine synthase A
MNPFSLVTILLKLEYFNPSGSIKDRIVKHIIADAERKGLLKPGGTIIENTSGNTGAAIAMLAAIRGYKAILTMPDKVSKEKQDALRAFGAELVICPTSASPDSPEHYVNKAKELHAKTPGSFRVNQYDNLKNPEAHYLSTGPEIWEQTGGDVDYLIAASSTGGTLSGTGRYLKEKNPHVKLILPDPVGSIYYPYFKTGRIPEGGNCNYFVEGVGEDHLAKALDFSIVDDVIPFTDKEAFETCRRLAQEEGILAGGSSGANVKIALDIAKTLTRPATLVVIIPDGGAKYLSKIYNDEWMKEKGLL